MMKRVLIITYYWPPTGGSGVQRWLKFSKYLPEFGWQPVIYTPLNPEAIVTDPSLEAEVSSDWEVIKRPIWEPYDLYRKLTGKKKGEQAQVNLISENSSQGLKSRLSLWVRANLFIPDPRTFWIRPSVRYLKDYLKEHPVDLMVSTGPPHSMHLLARNLKRKTGLRWIADFRDPWTRIFYFKHLPLMSWSRKMHERMERSVIREADEVVTVTSSMKREFSACCSADKARAHIHVVPNGFDLEAVAMPAAQDEVLEDGKFCMTHTGLLPQEGNPSRLWEVLDELCQEYPDFCRNLRIRLIGKTDAPVLSEIHSRKYLSQAEIIDMGYMPHSEICSWQRKASVLLLPLRREPESAGILTGKYFEYLASGRYILAFGPEDGALAESLEQTGSGRIYDWKEKRRLKTYIRELYAACGFAEKEAPAAFSELRSRSDFDIQKFSRKNLTGEIVKIFNKEKQYE